MHKYGFFHIILSNLLNKGIAFATNVIIVGFLSKETYGIYGYSSNLLSFWLLFSGLGLSSAMLTFCAEDIPGDIKNQYYGFSLKFGSLVNLVMLVGLISFSFFFSFQIQGANSVFRMLVGIPLITYIKDYICLMLRSQLKNKEFSYSQSINSIFLLLFASLGAWFGRLPGYNLGIYLAHVFTIIFTLWYLRHDISGVLSSNLTKGRSRNEYLKYSIYLCLTAAAYQLLFLTDTYFVGRIINNSVQVADYKIASAIPFAFFFIPYTFCTFVQPYFARERTNRPWIKKMMLIFLGCNGIINLAVGAVLLLFSNWIIITLYGVQYNTAIPAFRVLLFAYVSYACLRIPIVNVLLMIRCVRFNLVNSILTCGLNVILDIVLITDYGIMGAAYATLIAVNISGLMAFGYYIYFINYLPQKGA